MQAIILAAGMGRRLGAITEHQTKCMVTVHGMTLIERSLEHLASVGVSRIILVVGYQSEGVVTHVGDFYKGIPIIYVHNSDYATTNNIYSLYLARDFLGEEDTLLLESDLIYDREILVRLVDDPAPNLAVVDQYKSWMDGTVVTLAENHTIERFIPKKDFRGTDIGGYFKTVNIYKLSREYLRSTYIPFLTAYVTAMGSNEYYEQVLRVVTTLEKRDLRALILDGEKWYEIDDIQDLQNAETVFAADTEQYDSYLSRHGGYWRFPDLIDFCYLVNPYFPPQKMVEEMERSLPQLLTRYPSALKVNDVLAARLFGIEPANIVTGNGAAELITLLGNLHADQNAVISLPTFEEYTARFDRAATVSPTQDIRLDLGGLRAASRNADTVILVNPDNPSGYCLSTEELSEFAAHLEATGKRLILDESFIDFTDPEHCESLLTPEWLQKYPSMIVIKSISKSYGVPGARLGVAASADEDLMSRMRQAAPVWNINSLGEFFLQIIGKYTEDYAKACALIRQDRDIFFNLLTKVEGVLVQPSHANYFLVKLKNGAAASDVASRLLKDYRILVKDCSSKAGFDGDEYLRIAVQDHNTNLRFLDAFTKVLAEIRDE